MADDVAADPVTIGGVYRFFDDVGNRWLEIPVAVDMLAVIEELDAALIARDKRARNRSSTGRERHFTDMQWDEDSPRYDPPDRHSNFIPAGKLVGIGAIWPGPAGKGQPCPICDQKKLPERSMCLYCTRIPEDILSKKIDPELPGIRAKDLDGGLGKSPEAIRAAVRAKPKKKKAPGSRAPGPKKGPGYYLRLRGGRS